MPTPFETRSLPLPSTGSASKASEPAVVFSQPSHRAAANDTALRAGFINRAQDPPTFDPPVHTDDAVRAEELIPSTASILQQLRLLLQSRTFTQSEKLSRFLRFVVEHVLEGKQSCLKEYLVGVEVYDRKQTYDPNQDSIVRTEARRLRNKLKEYYGAEGKNDPVYIYLQPGSYIPYFHCREELTGPQVALVHPAPVVQQRSPAAIAVLRFNDVSQNTISGKYACCVPDELAYALMSEGGCTVIYPTSIGHVGSDIASAMNEIGATILFEGSVKLDDSQLRVTARIIDAAGAQLWLTRIDVEVGAEATFAVEEQIARDLVLGYRSIRTSVSIRCPSAHG